MRYEEEDKAESLDRSIRKYQNILVLNAYTQAKVWKRCLSFANFHSPQPRL